MKRLRIFALAAIINLTALTFMGCSNTGGTSTTSSDGSTVTVVPPNTAPVANAGPDQSVTTGAVVTLDGSGSTDADGDALTYSWSFTSKPTGSTAALVNATTVNPKFTADLNGDYAVGLVVNDGTIDSVADMVTVTAAPGVWSMLKLPDTGQTGDYTTTFGEDSDYTINPMAFTNNLDGTVTDNVTGLMWQQQDDDVVRTWVDAGTYCDGLSLGGQTDWRLPNEMELMSIVNYGTYSPAIDTTYFPNTDASYYWSSPTDASNTSYAWYVHFSYGYVSSLNKTNSYYVRCVRGANDTPVGKNFTDNGNGTVTDNNTTLMWQKEDDNAGRTWESAISYCEGLSLAGYTDWRLPNDKELRSIVDNIKSNPAIDTTYFPNTDASTYWSSTASASSAYGTDGAWGVYFYVGSVYDYYKTYNFYVRCVR